MFLHKLSTKYSLFLVALLVVAAIGCGQMDSSPTDGIISGDDDAMTGKTPEVSIFKTTMTGANETEISYHIKIDVEASVDLVVGLEVRIGDTTEGSIVIIRQGTTTSEAFSFGDNVQQVTLLEHEKLLSFKSTVAAINTAETLSVDFEKYPLHQRRYILSQNRQVSR